METGLSGKVAVITGGASGLGLETARYLVREGTGVLIADIDEKGLQAAEAELRAAGGKAIPLRVDVRSPEECRRMADRARQAFGRIDVCVAAAGVGDAGLFLETRPEDWNRLIDINLKGVLNTNHAVAPAMVAQRAGSIINIASEAGKVGEKRISVYSATKGGVIAFSKAFALEMGRFNVRVNALCPGVTLTPMTADYTPDRIAKAVKFYPLGRLGRPRDVAAFITFLASDESSWVTGQALSVNGGFARS